MKKTFRLEGLDCAHCASKIETAVQALPGVTSATVNFMTTKLTLECEDGKVEQITSDVTETVKRIEPHVIVKKG